MKNRKRASLLLAAAAVVAASCSTIEKINAPALAPGRADFSVVAAVGSGITAGFQSGGLVDRHQTHGYASLFAQQVGARPLDLPLVGGDGIPPLLELKHLYPPPIQIGPISATPGTPPDPLFPSTYHNLGVPGALLQDLTDTTQYVTNPYFALIQRGRGSIARQIADPTQLNPQPTFLLVEYGMSDLLRPALLGTTVGLLSVANFEIFFRRGLDELATVLPSAKLAVVNVPDVTAMPFFTTVSNKQLDASGQPVLDANGKPKFLLGPLFDTGGKPLPLTANDLVLLSAQPQVAGGFGYPVGTISYLSGSPVAGNGAGLTDAQVLSNSEALTVQDRARRFNSIIDTTSRSAAKPRDFATVDLDGLLRRAKSPGIEIRRVFYTSTFVTGGLFDLAGLYPNDLAHALLCNEVIRAVNAKFGSNIQPVDPLRFATFTASSASGSREAGPLPTLR
jgi:hypothetical protein